MTGDFFRSRVDALIDLRHALAVLATRMLWAQIETSLMLLFAHHDRGGRGGRRASICSGRRCS